MASTFSDLKIELIATGEQSGTWGTTTNTNLGTALEEAIVGRATADFTTDADLTITLTNTNATQVARNYILNVTSGVSLSTTRNLIVPTINKPYIIENNTTGGQSIVVKTSAGTGITVPNGKTMMVYANGTNVVSALTNLPSGTTVSGNAVVAGPASSTDNAIARFDGTTGALIQNSNVIIADDGTTVISVNSASDALRITQTGAGNALVVEDSTNPDSTPFVVDASGNVGIGTTSPSQPLQIYNATSAQIHIQGDSSTAFNALRASSDTTASFLTLRKARGTIASPTAANGGDNAGNISLQAYGGTNYRAIATIVGTVETYTSDTNISGYLTFNTNSGGTSASEKMRIDSAGNVGIGSASATAQTLRIAKNVTGATVAYGIVSQGVVQSDVTSETNAFYSGLNTAAASFTLPNFIHYVAQQDTIGAGSSITNQFGFVAQAGLTGATNNYGFYSNIASGTGRWNFYANGTAENYFNGATTVNANLTVTNGAVTARINPRVSTTASASSITPDVSAYDQYNFTALAATLAINAPIGTPVDGNKLIFRILDDGTSRTLNWNGTYTAIGVVLPTTTTINKTTYVGCIYNANNTRWDVVAVSTQA